MRLVIFYVRWSLYDLGTFPSHHEHSRKTKEATMVLALSGAFKMWFIIVSWAQVCLPSSSTHENRGRKQFGATPATVGFYVEASFMLHLYLALVLGGFRLGGHNKATVLNRVSQAALMPFQLGRSAYHAILFCWTLLGAWWASLHWPLLTPMGGRSSPSCVTYKETKDQRDVLAGSTSCLGFISESVNCS